MEIRARLSTVFAQKKVLRRTLKALCVIEILPERGSPSDGVLEAVGVPS